MNTTNKLSPQKYAELVATQNKAKAISQKSYHLNQLEKKFPLQEINTDAEAEALICAYLEIIN